VWYLAAKDEGHGFAKKKNADFQFYTTVLFMQTYLMGEVGREATVWPIVPNWESKVTFVRKSGKFRLDSDRSSRITSDCEGMEFVSLQHRRGAGIRERCHNC
jgi:hypothetical protein